MNRLPLICVMIFFFLLLLVAFGRFFDGFGTFWLVFGLVSVSFRKNVSKTYHYQGMTRYGIVGF